MPIEKLRKEFTAEFWGRFVDASVRDRLSSQITDWWINKILEREKELYAKMEEKRRSLSAQIPSSAIGRVFGNKDFDSKKLIAS